MTDHIEIIHSPLAQTYSAGGHSLDIQIYRTPDTHWVLEVVDERGTSTVWDELFETDKLALEDAIKAMTHEMGIAYLKVAQKNTDDASHYDIEHTGSILLFNPQGKLVAFFTTPHQAALLAKDYMLLIA